MQYYLLVLASVGYNNVVNLHTQAEVFYYTDFFVIVLTAICWIISSISIYNPEIDYEIGYYNMHSHSPLGNLLWVWSENNNEELKEIYLTKAYRVEINYVVGFIVTLFLLIMIKIRFLHIFKSILAKMKAYARMMI